MDRRYKEDDILLILNYDTHGRKCLKLIERCMLHKLFNDLSSNRPIELTDELKGLIARILTEINHKKYKRINAH